MLGLAGMTNVVPWSLRAMSPAANACAHRDTVRAAAETGPTSANYEVPVVDQVRDPKLARSSQYEV